ncbi:MAG: hypothetical protein JWO86_5532 [Myxococcaceae bacterium]|nr:hypothetical protein [Myxococcaceae bacterium]
MPYRIPAPPEPEDSDVEDPYAAVLRAQRRRARLVSLVVVVFLAGGVAKVARSHQPPRRHVTEAVRIDGARVAIDGARARAASAQSRFEAAMREAIRDDVSPRPDLGACPIALPAASSLVSGRSAFPLLTVDHDGLDGTLPSQAVAGVLSDVRRAETHLATGRFEEAKLYARALDRPERFGYDVVLVARTTREPRAVSGKAYEPGEIEGRAYLYEFASGRVVCAGDVAAKSSKEVGYVYSDRSDTPPSLGPVASMGDAIHEDIRLQTERAIVAALRWRSGPRL